jgi:hypothetical protein
MYAEAEVAGEEAFLALFRFINPLAPELNMWYDVQ